MDEVDRKVKQIILQAVADAHGVRAYPVGEDEDEDDEQEEAA